MKTLHRVASWSLHVTRAMVTCEEVIKNNVHVSNQAQIQTNQWCKKKSPKILLLNVKPWGAFELYGVEREASIIPFKPGNSENPQKSYSCKYISILTKTEIVYSFCL